MRASAWWRPSLALLLFANGCTPPAAECPKTEPLPAASSPILTETSTFHVRGEDASLVTFDRMGTLPEPGWAIPRSISFSPDKKSVTYLASESGNLEMALFEFDLEKRAPRLLLRAKDLMASDKPLSREEELRRERMRERATGISSYAWAQKENVLIAPLGGDLFVRKADGKSVQLTKTSEPELDPKLCPKGDKVFYVRGSEILMMEVESQKETALTKGAPNGVTRGQSDFIGQEEMDEPSGYFPSPNCEKVLYLEVDERQVKTHVVLGYRDKKPDYMEQKYPASGEKNPKVTVQLMDVKSKKTLSIKVPGDKEKELYLGRFQWAEDGSVVFFQAMTRDQKKLTLYRADSRVGAVTELATETSPGWVKFSTVKLLSKSSELLWTVERAGHMHLETRDRATGKLGVQLTQGPWDVTRIEAVDEERKIVYFSGTKERPVERHLYSVSMSGGEPVKITSEHGMHAVTVHEKAGAYVDIHSALDRPPQVVVRDLSGAIVGALPVPQDKEIESLKLRSPEIVEVKGEGGETFYGSLLKPRTVDPHLKHPVVLMVYGGPGVQTVTDKWGPALLWQHLADRGFVVFQLDNRGSIGRGPAFEQPIFGKLGTVELQDQLTGVEYLKKLPFVDPARIGIYGHSYGGFMAALAMVKAPTVFKVGVAAAPVTEWQLYDTGYTERYMGVPEANVEGYQASDLTRLAKGLSGKLLIIHSLMDENVHFQHTADFMDALVTENKPFDLVLFPGERHGYRSPKARKYALHKVASYFAEYL